MICYFDTALTGRYRYRERDDHATQPHLARLAFMVVTEGGETILEQSALVRPRRGWTYEIDAITAHHIGPEIANDRGVSLADAVGPFVQALAEATTIVAYNYDHHRRVILRAGFDLALTIPIPEMEDPRAFCAMRAATELVRAPKIGPGGGIRWPRMPEAYGYFANGAEPAADPDPIVQGKLNLGIIRTIHEGIERERSA